jgi:hypothetical protein
MNRSIQSQVDRLLLDQGEYQPLEYLSTCCRRDA